MIYKKTALLIFFLPFLLLLQACGSSDTVMDVSEGPRPAATGETEPDDEEDFKEISLGIIDPVTNFDPLFADNLSTQRILSLIYQGLFTLNKTGEPVPAIAKEVEISDDGLEYLFSIDRDIYFHDSSAFTAGVGRRIHASDVKWAFQRSANVNVPGHAARLLMGISGFENYYLEQQSVHDPEQRVLQEVTGIEVLDAETLLITLEEADPDFLRKLASPYLFIYPREAVERPDASFSKRPVGSNFYRLNQYSNTNEFMLVRTQGTGNRARFSQPQFNRINVFYNSNEAELFQKFARQEIDWIPELGPQTVHQVTTENYELASPYQDSYSLIKHEGYRTIYFYLNENSSAGVSWLKNRLADLTNEDLTVRGDISIQVDHFSEPEEALADSSYFTSFTRDLTSRKVLSDLNNMIRNFDSSIILLDISVPVRRTALYTDSGNSLFADLSEQRTGYWLKIESPVVSISQPHVTGIEPANVPWLLYLESVSVRNTERSPS